MREKDLRGVGMKRREFLTKIFITVTTLATGIWTFTKKVLPKRFVWAKPVLKYPGKVKEIKNIEESKWSG